jgi:hypothetical protein
LKNFIILQKVPGFANKTLLPEINSSDIDAENSHLSVFLALEVKRFCIKKWNSKQKSFARFWAPQKYIQICPEGY